MKNTLFLLLFLLAPLFMAGQNASITSLIYLKDGSLLKGEIISKSDNQVTIKLLSGTEITLKTEEIKQMKTPKKPVKVFPNGQSLHLKGFYHIIGTNIMVAEQALENSNELRWGAGLYYTAGYRINKFFGAGLGIDLDFYARDFAPIYLHLKGELFEKMVSPTYTLNAGYSIPLSEWFDNDDGVDSNGGWMFNPSIGVRIATSGGGNLQFDVGYKFQYYSERAGWDWAWVEDEILLKSLSLKMGLVF